MSGDIRVAIAGTGYWGESWVPIVQAAGGAELSGVYGRSAETLGQVGARYALADEKLFSSLDEFLGARHDLVILTAHHGGGLHRTLGESVLRAGSSLLIEKPFAESVEDAVYLTELAQKLGLRLLVDQNFRYHDNVLAVRQWLRDGLIGDVLGVDVQMRGWFPPDMAKWRLEQPYPHVLELGVHSLDLIRMLLGSEPVEVRAVSRHLANSHFASASMTSAVIALRSGVCVNWLGNSETRAHFTNVTGVWHIYGTRGVIEIDNEAALCLEAEGGTTNIVAGVEGSPSLGSGRDRLLDAVIQDLAGFARVSHDAEDNLRTMNLVEAIMRSSESGLALRLAE